MAFEPLEGRDLLATITVNTLIDVNNGSDGLTTLREAIAAAASGDTINFSVTGTIALTSTSSGHLTINKNLSIVGPGANLLTIKAFDPDANGNNDRDGRRVFLIDDGSSSTHRTVLLSGMTLTNGDPGDDDESTAGGAVFNRENLTISECVITGNHAPHGGGVYTRTGMLTILDSTISGNVGEDGGGLLLESGTATVLRTTFENNYAGNDGGAIFKRGGTLFVTDSTLSGNATDLYGGGINNYAGNTTITNSTISGNSANQRGGGIYNRDGSMAIAHSTITGNSVSSQGHSGGGITSGSTLTLNHTIVAGNVRGASTRDDVSGSTESSGTGSFNAQFSLIGDRRSAPVSNQGGSQIGTTSSPINAMLGPLADHGGPTRTHALLAGSPAIDAGNASAVAGQGGIPLNDQRGAPFSRIADGDDSGGDRIDLGAFEVPTPVPAGPAVPGDYNRNNVVDAADYVLWRKTLGGSVPQYEGADGDGDETIDPDDYDVWAANFGGEAPAEGGGGAASDGESFAAAAGQEAGTTNDRPATTAAPQRAEWFARSGLAAPSERLAQPPQQAVVAEREIVDPLLNALLSAEKSAEDIADIELRSLPEVDTRPIDEVFFERGGGTELDEAAL